MRGATGKYLTYAIAALICVYLAVIAIRALSQSAFFDTRDRINLVYYQEEPVMLSFGLSDNVHYIIRFSHGDKVSVPGGYGRYLIGSLGKLADLEDNPRLVLRTFSSMSSAYVDYVVMKQSPDIYEDSGALEPSFSQFSFIKALWSRGSFTNAGLFDKMYLTFLLSKKRENDFIVLRSTSEQNSEGGVDFSEKSFLKKYRGFFYHQELREEARDVRILYESYPGAVTLSRIIEGQGIRVVDLSQAEEETPDRCRVVYRDSKGETERYLERRFRCSAHQGETEGSDILFIMGRELTEEWK